MRLLQRGEATHPAPSRQPVAGTFLRPWLLGWLGLPVLGVANGAIREATYQRAVSDLAAHQVSTATLLGLMTVYMQALNRRWPPARLQHHRRGVLGRGAPLDRARPRSHQKAP